MQSLVLLVVLVTLPSCLARRGRGGQHYRTEEDRRETRRKLSEQRDPRRAGWSESETRSRAGEGERGRQSLEKSRKPFLETVTYQDISTIFGDFEQKSTQDDKHRSNEEQRGRTVEIDTLDKEQDITPENVEREVSSEIDSAKQNYIESTTDFTMIDEEGSGEVPDTALHKTKKEGTIVTINGRKAVVKKRKRGKHH